VLPRTYDNQVCSVARALEAIGDRWTMLVIRDAFVGVRRFDEFQERLGIARNVLTDRLSRLVDEGILDERLLCVRCGEPVTALNAEARQLVPSAG
jgi:DNA-binding HxlR family transcriptional regulator